MKNQFSEANKAIRMLGNNVDIARKRRGMTMSKLAGLSGTSVSTLRKLIRGDQCVQIGVVADVLFILHLNKDLECVADPLKDEVGLFYELRRLPRRVVEKYDPDYDF